MGTREKNEAFDYLAEQDFPDSAEYLNKLSYAALRKGDLRAAFDYSQKSVKIKDDYLEGYDLLSLIGTALYQDEMEEATKFRQPEKEEWLKKIKEYATKAISLSNRQKRDQLARIYSNRGISNLWLGLKEEALEDFKEAKSIQQKDPKNWINLSHVYASIGDLNSALNAIEKVIELGACDISVLKFKAQILIEKGDPDEAVLLLENEVDDKNIDRSKLDLYCLLIEAYD